MNKNGIITRLAFSVAITLITLICVLTNAFSNLDNLLVDSIYQHKRQIETDVLIVAIDEKSINELGKYESWNRSYYAKVIENLSKDSNNKPAVIGVDVIFNGESSLEYDSDLVNAVNDAKNVVLGSKIEFGSELVDDHISSTANLTLPFDALNSVSSTGFTNTIPDTDNYVRKVLTHINKNGIDEDSFALTIYKKYAAANGYDVPNLKENQEYYLDFYSKPGQDFTTVSFVDVYNGIVPNYIKNSIVLIGAYTSGLQDDYLVPISRGNKMNGVEIHANIIEALYHDSFSKDVSKAIIYITYLLIVFIASFMLTNKKLRYALIFVPILIASFIGLGLILKAASLVYPVSLPITMLVVILLYQIINKYVIERIEKRKVVGALKQYVPHQVVEGMVKDSSYKVSLSGTKKPVACLFVDIRGFTKMSEESEPEEIVNILNKYLGMVTDQIFKNDGMLDKYVGDAVMAVFNAPNDIEDYEVKACRTALDILNEGKAIQEEILKTTGKTIKYGVGVHVGDAVIGNIGCEFRKDFTAIGDTVNTAARLEANAKGDQILISEDLYLRIKDRFECNYVGPLQFKNKANPTICYEIIREVKND